MFVYVSASHFLLLGPGTLCPGHTGSAAFREPQLFVQPGCVLGLLFGRNSAPLLSQAELETHLQAFAALSLGQSPPRLPWPPAPLAIELSTPPSLPRDRKDMLALALGIKSKDILRRFFSRD